MKPEPRKDEKMTVTWTQINRYFQVRAANTNAAPQPRRNKPDLNALRITQQQK